MLVMPGFMPRIHGFFPKTMAGYGLVRLERGERRRITPKITHDRVELDLPLLGRARRGKFEGL
jgi:predicted transcriptional regulator